MQWAGLLTTFTTKAWWGVGGLLLPRQNDVSYLIIHNICCIDKIGQVVKISPHAAGN